jgi:hypothetical protein
VTCLFLKRASNSVKNYCSVAFKQKRGPIEAMMAL